MMMSCTDDTDPSGDYTRTIDRIEIAYLYDNVTYELLDKNPPAGTDPKEIIEGVELNGEFNSIAGASDQISNLFLVTYEGNVVLGKSLSGVIDYNFKWNSVFSRWELNVKLGVDVKISSFINGDVCQEFDLDISNLLPTDNYIDDFTGLEVDEYTLMGDDVCSATTNLGFVEDTDNYKTTLLTRGCGDRALVKVKVHNK